MKKILYILFASGIMLAVCTKLPSKAVTYKGIYDERPLSILIMPPINKTNEVEAKELFYSSITIPLSEKGYYVMSPLLSLEFLKEQSAYDSEEFVNSSMKKIGEVFGVDAVLFTTIKKWQKSTVGMSISVTINYVIKSAKTDEIIFERTGNITYSPSNGNGLAGLVANMVSTALTKKIDIGRICNVYTLSDMPAGKYNSLFGRDGSLESGKKDFSVTVN